MLQQAVRLLPKGVKVVLLADRGFVHTDLMHAITTQWGWHFRIRLKKDTWIWRSGKGWCQLKDFHFKRGEAFCFHNVRLHKEQSYGPLHLVFGCNNVNGELWAIVSDEKTTLQVLSRIWVAF